MIPRLSQRIARQGLAPAIGARAISVQSILHGSPEAKKEGEELIQQHGRLVGRGKYIHGFEVHKVKPDKVEDYKKAAEAYYGGVKDDSKLHVKLSGSWEVIVGEQDTFIHILEYEHYGGYDKTMALVNHEPQHVSAYNAMRPFLNSRTLQLASEFAMVPTAPPHIHGGIFELRSYLLKPGKLLEWEHTWRRGIEARRQFVSPVGAWYSQVGHLHEVHHLWQYQSMEQRKELRENAWKVDGWAETVSKTAELAKGMDSYILSPLSFSPLK